jgi:AraC-like DNA-binding protein
MLPAAPQGFFQPEAEVSDVTDKVKTFYEQELERIAQLQAPQACRYVQIRQSKAFIDQYHAEKIELEAMAAAAYMSRFHYIRMFQQIYGITPRQYLRDLRIAKSKPLLRQGLSVTQVCFAVGYESLPTFSRVFKQGTGYSPRAYQQLHNRNRE